MQHQAPDKFVPKVRVKPVEIRDVVRKPSTVRIRSSEIKDVPRKPSSVRIRGSEVRDVIRKPSSVRYRISEIRDFSRKASSVSLRSPRKKKISMKFNQKTSVRFSEAFSPSKIAAGITRRKTGYLPSYPVEDDDDDEDDEHVFKKPQHHFPASSIADSKKPLPSHPIPAKTIKDIKKDVEKKDLKNKPEKGLVRFNVEGESKPTTISRRKTGYFDFKQLKSLQDKDNDDDDDDEDESLKQPSVKGSPGSIVIKIKPGTSTRTTATKEKDNKSDNSTKSPGFQLPSKTTSSSTKDEKAAQGSRVSSKTSSTSDKYKKSDSASSKGQGVELPTKTTTKPDDRFHKGPGAAVNAAKSDSSSKGQGSQISSKSSTTSRKDEKLSLGAKNSSKLNSASVQDQKSDYSFKIKSAQLPSKPTSNEKEPKHEQSSSRSVTKLASKYKFRQGRSSEEPMNKFEFEKPEQKLRDELRTSVKIQDPYVKKKSSVGTVVQRKGGRSKSVSKKVAVKFDAPVEEKKLTPLSLAIKSRRQTGIFQGPLPFWRTFEDEEDEDSVEDSYHPVSPHSVPKKESEDHTKGLLPNKTVAAVKPVSILKPPKGTVQPIEPRPKKNVSFDANTKLRSDSMSPYFMVIRKRFDREEYRLTRQKKMSMFFSTHDAMAQKGRYIP